MKTILLAEDDAWVRKVLTLRLNDAGYDVVTAADGAEALERARVVRPEAVLSAVTMPRMNGFKLCEALRRDPELGAVPVVLASAGAIEPADRELSQAVGANAYVQRTPECEQILEALATSLNEEPLPALEDTVGLMADLRREFLADGQRQSALLLESLPENFDPELARQVTHRWAGVGGTLGFPQISQMAYQIELDLRQEQPDAARLRSALEDVVRLFADAERAQAPEPVMDTGIGATLAGKRIALVGFEPGEAARLVAAFAAAQAVACGLSLAEAAPDSPVLDGFELVVLALARGADSSWLSGSGRSERPLLVIGSREALLAQAAWVNERAWDFLLSPWCPEEAILRAAQVLQRVAAATGAPDTTAAAPGTDIQAVVADDDLTTAALVAAILRKHHIACHIARHGRQALELVRKVRPNAIVLDVVMPRMSGFEVLKALKEEPATASIPVLLLTARHQESDVLLGFGLGAEDYMVKPFNPLELVARLRRLVVQPAAQSAVAR